MAAKSPPIKTPFRPLRLPPGDVSADLVNQNLDRISAAFNDLHAQLQVNYVALPSSSGGGTITVNGGPVPLGPDILGDFSGTEAVVAQWLLDSGSYGTTLTFSLLADFLSAVGSAVFRLRLGGTSWDTSGTVVWSRTQPVTGTGMFEADSTDAMASSPGGLQRLKLTVQSSASEAMAQLKDGFVSVSS